MVMPIPTLRITKDDFTPAIQRMMKVMTDWKPALNEAGEYMLSSLDRNFQAGGRPEAWKPLSSATLLLSAGFAEDLKRKEGQQTATVRRGNGSKPLRSNDKLMASVTKKGAAGNVFQVGTHSVSMGSNLRVGGKYNLAKLMHGGAHPKVTPKSRAFFRGHGIYLKKGKAHMDIPARPFYLFQTQDKPAIVRILEHYIQKAWNGGGGRFG